MAQSAGGTWHFSNVAQAGNYASDSLICHVPAQMGAAKPSQSASRRRHRRQYAASGGELCPGHQLVRGHTGR